MIKGGESFRDSPVISEYGYASGFGANNTLENDKRTLSLDPGLFFQKTDFRSNGSIKNIGGIQLGVSGFAGFVCESIWLKM